jgi:hypothetical protein
MLEVIIVLTVFFLLDGMVSLRKGIILDKRLGYLPIGNDSSEGAFVEFEIDRVRNCREEINKLLSLPIRQVTEPHHVCHQEVV